MIGRDGDVNAIETTGLHRKRDIVVAPLSISIRRNPSLARTSQNCRWRHMSVLFRQRKYLDTW